MDPRVLEHILEPNSKTSFTLAGFTQRSDTRIFSFNHTGSDQVRRMFTVAADLTLARKHRIPLQELPLLCRAFLERCGQSRPQQPLTFTEDEMTAYARAHAAAVAEAAKNRRPPKRSPRQNLGNAWRAEQPR